MAANPADTIFAVSSGAAPAAIAVLRISGPQAFAAGEALAGTLPPPRRATLRRLRDGEGKTIDRALLLVFPGPATATGEDLIELHLHGGRAIVARAEAVLGGMAGLRPALPGEFTRRALANGRIDLAQAEGLADLLAAETEAQRRLAIDAVEGAVGRAVDGWTRRTVALSARAEALIDFADEDDVPADEAAVALLQTEVAALAAEIAEVLANPPVERLRDGVRVVIAGPPNAGKSTLINALADRQVAIATPIPGTTRDRIEAAVIRDGVAFRLTDTAGLTATDDEVEQIGVELARQAMDEADITVWLGDDAPPAGNSIRVQARADLPGRDALDVDADLLVSAQTGLGVAALWKTLTERARDLLPRADRLAFNRRQRDLTTGATTALLAATRTAEVLIIAEELRLARLSLDQVAGRAATDDMLDTLFGQFCIGK